MTLTEFLLARIGEVEAEAPDVHEAYCTAVTQVHWGSRVYDAKDCDCGLPARVLAECAAKRAIVRHLKDAAAQCPAGDWPEDGGMELALYADHARYLLHMLAQPYADRPDFDPAWTP